MTTNVIMPQLGESVVEGTVSQWLFKEGDEVKEYDALLEVSTDKVDTEVTSPTDGVLLRIYVEEGETVDAGTVLAIIGNPGDSVPDDAPGHSKTQKAAPEKRKEPEPATTPQASQAGALAGMRISPVVARMAAEHNLDLTQIEGTGRNGRITKKDVQAFLENGQQAAPQPAATPEPAPWETPGTGDLFKPTGEFKGAPARKPPAAAPSTPSPRAIPAEPVPEGTPGELMELSRIRRSIADHMVRSKLHTSPHVSTIFEVDLTKVLAHRAAHKDTFARQGVNLTLTAYFVAAMVEACQAVPILNSQWTDEGIYIHHTVNVGMAVAIDEGLIVPVIKHAERLNLLGLAQQVNDLAIRARNKQLKPDEVAEGTITVTNHGVSGSLFATPIINQPQAAIFSVGMMEKRVKVINDAIAIRPCSYIGLTFDHRIADGATADAWMMKLKEVLENWPQQ
jgi:2-oxoglutarate dehydrogenase E2 component (dihydrolipoamide succinyltransferase)